MNFSKAYHPQTNGQSEYTDKTVKDLLRACMLDFKKEWNEDRPCANLATTTDTTPASARHHMRPHMAEDVGLSCARKKLELEVSIDHQQNKANPRNTEDNSEQVQQLCR